MKKILFFVVMALIVVQAAWAEEDLGQKLLQAAARGDIAQVEELLQKGAKADARAEYKDDALSTIKECTPLMLASYYGHTDMARTSTLRQKTT